MRVVFFFFLCHLEGRRSVTVAVAYMCSCLRTQFIIAAMWLCENHFTAREMWLRKKSNTLVKLSPRIPGFNPSLLSFRL